MRALARQPGRIELLPLIRFASSLLAPPRCGICGAACATDATACQSCLAWLEAQRPGVARVAGIPVVWSCAYEGVARQLVTSLKFQGRVELGRLAGRHVAESLHAAALEHAAVTVVPVPAAPLRLRRRGFDPGELIAAGAARELGARLVHCLARRSGRRQVGRDRRSRLANPPRVRAISDVPPVALLVDDVLTTGATIGACAAALREGGCADVVAAVFARSLGPSLGGAYH